MNLVRQLLITSAPKTVGLHKMVLTEPEIKRVAAPMDQMGFILILRGQIIVTTHEEDRPMCLSEGDLIFITRAMDHRFEVTPTADHVLHNFVGSFHRGPRFSTDTPAVLVRGGFVFENTAVHPLLSGVPWCFILRQHEIAKDSPLEQMIRLICTELESGEPLSDDTKMWLLEGFVHYLFVHWARREARLDYWNAVLRDPQLGRALSLVLFDPRKWDVDAIASECGVSSARLRSLFKKAMGQGPGRYMSRLRVQQVKELLNGTDLPLSAIAERVGYADGFSMSKAFKRIEGCSPDEYRRSKIAAGARDSNPRPPA